jgi:acetolactate synthase-1/2/3 large subunit
MLVPPELLADLYGICSCIDFFRKPYVKYAEACGAVGFRVETLAAFAPAFQKALALNAPVLIDVAVDSEVYPPFSLGKV